MSDELRNTNTYSNWNHAHFAPKAEKFDTDDTKIIAREFRAVLVMWNNLHWNVFLGPQDWSTMLIVPAFRQIILLISPKNVILKQFLKYIGNVDRLKETFVNTE